MAKTTLGGKLIKYLLFFLVLFGIVTTSLTFFLIKDHMLKTEETNFLDANQKQLNIITRVFTDGENFIERTANNKNIIKYLENSDPEIQDKDVLEFLTQENEYPETQTLYIMDKTGKVLVSTDPRLLGNNYSFRDYFKKAINVEAKHNHEVAIGVTTKTPGYYTSTSIKNGVSEAIGVVVIKIEQKGLSNVIDINKNKKHINVMVIDKNGLVFFSNKEEQMFKSLGVLDESVKNKLLEQKIFGNDIKEIKALTYDLVLQALKNITTVKQFTFYDTREKEEEFINISYVEDGEIYIMTEESLDEHIQEAETIAIYMTIFFIIVLTLFIAIISKTTSTIFKPLEILGEVAKKFGSGDMEARVDIKTGDEIEDLADTFNNMAKNIKDSTQNIEKKVRERTAELQKLNDLMVNRELKMIELKKENGELKEKLAKK